MDYKECTLEVHFYLIIFLLFGRNLRWPERSSKNNLKSAINVQKGYFNPVALFFSNIKWLKDEKRYNVIGRYQKNLSLPEMPT